jgi:hypothetical protein
MKNLFKTLVISSTLLLSAGAAFADNNRVADHRTDRRLPPPVIETKPARPMIDQNVLDSERAFGRRGTVTLQPGSFRGQRGDMFVLSSDHDLDIRFVKITYARGRTVMLRGTRGRVLDIPDGGLIRSVEVAYVNRGARGAMIKLVAKGGFHHQGPDRDNGWGRGGRFGNQG